MRLLLCFGMLPGMKTTTHLYTRGRALRAHGKQLAVSQFIWTVLLVLILNSAKAADWTTWRGPGRDGICTEKGLLQKWPAGGPKLAWRTDGLGDGYSATAITGNTIFTMGKKDGTGVVQALDIEKQGKIIWQTPICESKYRQAYKGPRDMPTIDGDRVYALETMGTLVCLNTKTGKLIWKVNYVDDFGGVVPRWGFAESVLVDGDKVVCTPGGNKGTVVALDKMTGKTIWASKFGDKASYSSLVKISHEGVDQYAGFTSDAVIGVGAADGKPLWRYTKPAHQADWGDVNVMVPVWSDGMVFASSGYKTGGGMARIKKTAAGFKAEEEWFSDAMINHHGGVILLDGKLYGCSDPKNLKCMELSTGKVLWETKEVGKCCVLYADGMLYCRSEKGPISLVKATPEGFHLHGQFDQPDRSKEPSWTHPVISNGRLFIRDQGQLLCYDIQAR